MNEDFPIHLQVDTSQMNLEGLASLPIDITTYLAEQLAIEIDREIINLIRRGSKEYIHIRNLGVHVNYNLDGYELV
jgi:hypothetical protein